MLFYVLVLGTEGFVMAVLATSLPGRRFREGLAVGMFISSHLQEASSRLGEEGSMLTQNLSLR